MKALITDDGSKHSLKAVEYVVRLADLLREKLAVELVYVHLPLPYLSRTKKVVGKDAVQRYYEEAGTAALAGAKRVLDRAGIAYRANKFSFQ